MGSTNGCSIQTECRLASVSDAHSWFVKDIVPKNFGRLLHFIREPLIRKSLTFYVFKLREIDSFHFDDFCQINRNSNISNFDRKQEFCNFV